MSSFPALLVLALVGMAWWNALGTRKTARSTAKAACSRAGVAFIDELALQRLAVVRDRRSLLCLNRVYGFEFYVRGDVRYAGEIQMRGRHVASVRMDPYPEYDISP